MIMEKHKHQNINRLLRQKEKTKIRPQFNLYKLLDAMTTNS